MKSKWSCVHEFKSWLILYKVYRADDGWYWSGYTSRLDLLGGVPMNGPFRTVKEAKSAVEKFDKEHQEKEHRRKV